MSLSSLLSLSVLVPLAAGLYRYRNVDTRYYPFLLLIALGALTEIITTVVIHVFKQSNAPINNVWLLVECMLILYQFYAWRFYMKPRKWYRIVPAIFLAGWLVENVVFGLFFTFNPYFHAAYSFVIVMLSINEINYLITHDNRQLFRNSRFILCLAFIIYFIYQILLEGAYYVNSERGEEELIEIAVTITSYFSYINVLTNIIYAVAIFYIPVRRFAFDRAMESMREKQRKNGVRSSH